MRTDSDPTALQTGFIEYTDGNSVFEGYWAHLRSASQPTPCVVLAHEWSGLNAGMRAATERLAGSGYLAFALDVYGKGIRGEETGDNSALMNPLLADRALLRRRLLAGFQTAASHSLADASRMAALGYCFGGLCALDLARAAPDGLKAAISFHGALAPPNLEPQRPIAASILLLHGWEDRYAPPSDVLAIARELTEAGADWQLHAYGHAQHAFTFPGVHMPERGLMYNAAADRRSWAAMQAFLAERLA